MNCIFRRYSQVAKIKNRTDFSKIFKYYVLSVFSTSFVFYQFCSLKGFKLVGVTKHSMSHKTQILIFLVCRSFDTLSVVIAHFNTPDVFNAF